MSVCLKSPEINVNYLSHLLFCVGNVALKIYLYGEKIVEEMKQEKLKLQEFKTLLKEDDIINIIGQVDDEDEKLINEIAEVQLFKK